MGRRLWRGGVGLRGEREAVERMGLVGREEEREDRRGCLLWSFVVGYGIGPRLEGECGIGLCSMSLKISKNYQVGTVCRFCETLIWYMLRV